MEQMADVKSLADTARLVFKKSSHINTILSSQTQ